MRIVLVNDEDSWLEMYSRLQAAKCVCFDTETTCLDQYAHHFKVVGLAFSVDPVTGYYVPLNHIPPRQGTLFNMETLQATDPIIQLPEDWVIPQIKTILEEKEIMGHGLKFDYQAMMSCYGIELKNIVYDTLPASHILDERGFHNLKFVTEKYLGYKPMSFDDVVEGTGKKKGKKDRRAPSYFEYVHPKKAASYAAPDTVNPIRLRAHFKKQYMSDPRFLQLLTDEVKVVPELARMEGVGTYLNTAHLRDMFLDLSSELRILIDKIRAVAKNADLNPGSDAQMVDLIYGSMKVRRPKRPNTDESSNKGLVDRKGVERLMVTIRNNKQVRYGKWHKEEVLQLIQHFQHYTRLSKMNNTYTTSMIDKLSDDFKLHTSYNQLKKSGRLSSEQPNFQNMPRNSDPGEITYKYDVRVAFCANKDPKDKDYVYVLADYSAMEMRICAALSGCHELTEIVTGRRRDGYGNPIDIHLYTACAAFHLNYDEAIVILKDKNHPRHAQIKEYRQKAKPVNFGIIYGMTKWGLAADLNETVAVAETIIAGFMRAYPGVAAWMNRTETYLRAHLYTETAFGRRRRISHAELHDNKAFKKAYRACLNHQIQGTGADIIKKQMVRVSIRLKEMGVKGELAGQVHDELLVRCPYSEHVQIASMMVKEMHFVLKGIDLPVEADVKYTWSKMETPIWSIAA